MTLSRSDLDQAIENAKTEGGRDGPSRIFKDDQFGKDLKWSSLLVLKSKHVILGT